MAEATTLNALPPETLDGHLGILATSGAGKTYGAKTAVEDLLDAGRRVCVIDPTGVWWGLRANPDGSEGGYPVAILGGDHADAPIADTSGVALARTVAEGDFSCVVDVVRMTVGQRTRLFSDFAEELARINRRPLHLVIDEAHLFMPQGRVNDPQSARMVGAANHLVSGGRAMGLRIMLLSQRPAKLHKDSLTQVATLVPMWMMAPQDTAAVKAWISDAADPAQGRELLASLPKLQVGRGWVWAPRIGLLSPIAFQPIKTFDSSRAPVADEELPEARLSTLPIAALRAALAAEPEPSVGGGASAQARRASKAELDAAEARGYAAGRSDERKDWALWLHRRREEFLRDLSHKLDRDAMERYPGPEISSAPEAEHPSPKPAPAAKAKLTADKATPAKPKPQAGVTEPLSDSAEDLITTARCAPRQVSWVEAAILAGRVPAGGHFETVRRELRDKGWETPPPNDLAADAPLDVADIWERLAAKFEGKGRAAAIFRNFFARGPLSRDQAAASVDAQPRGGHWETGWRAIRKSPLTRELTGGRFDVAEILRELKDGAP